MGLLDTAGKDVGEQAAQTVVTEADKVMAWAEALLERGFTVTLLGQTVMTLKLGVPK